MGRMKPLTFRRLTAGETKESAVAEVKALPGAEDTFPPIPLVLQ